MELIIVRHALPYRADGENATADPELTELGRRQAASTAEFLAGETIDAIVASPLRRAHQTAEPLAGRLGLAIETVEGLREIDPFGGAYVPAEEITDDHPIVQAYAEDRFSLFGDEQGFRRFRATVVAAFDEVVAANRGRRVSVFCHGTVIGTYLSSILGHDDPLVLLPDYCGISRVLASSTGERTLRSVNETGHVRGLETVASIPT
jgi:2,3-bisphosphoglycerate-dependent phosphoglycerate mutase